jgi:alkanesulfonate monooxygenase SsuD/methylene tetrahydromethanopterin reductase-like flavin-dependent oxidoreductase (luciferase family)
MKIGAYFLCENFAVFISSVRCAEASGFDRIWITDSQLLSEDVYVYMAHGLSATERIQFGSGVTNPVTRHYTVLSSAHATLARLHPGRVILGIGRGDSAVYTAGLKPMATREFALLLPRLKPLMMGRAIEADGNEMRMTWANESVPLMVSATGPRNLRLAGAHADIVQMMIGVRPAGVGWAIDHIRAGAEEAGRDPAEVEISLLCPMWISDDVQEARHACRWGPPLMAVHLESAARHNPDHGMPRALTHIIEAKRGKYNYYTGLDPSAEHTLYLTDELIDDFAIAGPAERCLERIHELADVGVGELAIAFLNGQLEQMERVGREIIQAPGMRSA